MSIGVSWLGVSWYKPVTCLSIHNPDVIPLMLIMRWHGQHVGGSGRLSVVAQKEKGGDLWLKFHKALWDNVDDSEESACRRGRLRLEGAVDGVEVFAILHMDIAIGKGSSIIFSPVPFGPDGRPMLPKGFLLESAAVACRAIGTNAWSYGYFKGELSASDGKANSALMALKTMGVIKVSDGYYRTIMDAGTFESVFGVKLPEFPLAPFQ